MQTIPLTHGLSATIRSAKEKMEQIMGQFEAEAAFDANLRGFPMECAVFGHSYPRRDTWVQTSPINWEEVTDFPAENCERCGIPHIDIEPEA